MAGYQLHYEKNWRGYLSLAWGRFILFVLFVGGITGLHSTITNFNNVVIFTESISYSNTCLMCFLRVTVFFMQRKRIAKLVEDLMAVTETGELEIRFYRNFKRQFF
jgi:hypothetical protein